MESLLNPAILGIMIPIVAVVTAGTVILARVWMRHRERMAMIEMGMHPDHPEDEHVELDYEDRVELSAPTERSRQ